EKAIALDSSLSEAHVSLGLYALHYGWDWATAEREYRRALELNPENAFAHRSYSMLLLFLVRTEDALRETQRAVELDPLSGPSAFASGPVLFCARRYGEAIAVLKKALEIDPTFPGTYSFLTCSYQLKGQEEDAIAWAEKTVSFGKFAPFLSLRGML